MAGSVGLVIDQRAAFGISWDDSSGNRDGHFAPFVQAW